VPEVTVLLHKLPFDVISGRSRSVAIGAPREGVVTGQQARISSVANRSTSILCVTLLGAAMLAACGTVTKIPNAWRNPAHEGMPFKKIFVIGVGKNDANRRLFEDQFAAVLSGHGAVASPSYGALPHSERLSEEQVRGAIEGGGYDGVIVTRLLGVEEKTEYIPPRTYTVPRHYGGYYNYYGTTWDVVHQPGYFETHTIVRLETNLYDVGSGELVWSGQSETFNPDSLEDIIDSATQAVAKRLGDESLIP
jgi:hypothetical protein